MMSESVMEDIAESLRIISGRSTLKESRLRAEIADLNMQRSWTYTEEGMDELNNKICKIEDEIYQDRLKRENKGGEE